MSIVTKDSIQSSLEKLEEQEAEIQRKKLDQVKHIPDSELKDAWPDLYSARKKREKEEQDKKANALKDSIDNAIKPIEDHLSKTMEKGETLAVYHVKTEVGADRIKIDSSVTAFPHLLSILKNLSSVIPSGFGIQTTRNDKIDSTVVIPKGRLNMGTSGNGGRKRTKIVYRGSFKGSNVEGTSANDILENCRQLMTPEEILTYIPKKHQDGIGKEGIRSPLELKKLIKANLLNLTLFPDKFETE